MTDKEGFSVDELRKWHEENGFEERLACPICRFNIKPITDEEQLNFRGFSKNINPEFDGGLILAKFGICDNLHRENDEFGFSYYGVPLILESELKDSVIEIDYSEVDDDTPFDQNITVIGPSTDTWFNFKSKIANTLGEFKYQLAPPYEISQYIYSYTGDEETDRFEESENHNPQNEWFDVLGLSLWEMRNLKHDKSRIIQHILPTIYLHKTGIMDNIEPLWVFMRRFGMNLRATKISIANYPVALPTHVQELVRKVQSYEVSRASIESFTFMSRNNSLLGNLDNKQLNEIIDNASKILAVMKESEYSGGKTIYQFISENSIVSDELTIGGCLLPPVGIIEGFCVFAALAKSNPKIAEDFLQQMYPKEQSSIWQWSLTDFGQAFGNIEVLNGLIKMINL